MFDYYDRRLSAERLKQAYQIAQPRVQRYLKAEIDHVMEKIHPGDRVLELGCGFGRVLGPMSQRAALAVGIDTSLTSLIMAREELGQRANLHLGGVDAVRPAREPPAERSHLLLAQMDAVRLALGDGTFDLVACVQNGISAFHVDQKDLIRESVRVTRPGGTVLFSSYSEKFWEHRLEWFRLQAEAGLLGEIDLAKSRHGRIVCRDGFTATTVCLEQFRQLTEDIDGQVEIAEVDGSSLFCEIIIHESSISR